jgi:hypothetical protein
MVSYAKNSKLKNWCPIIFSFFKQREKFENTIAVNRRRTDNTIAKRRRADNTIAKRRRADNTIAKRRRADNTIAKRRTATQ